MRLYYKLIFLWVFISACGNHTDWQRPYDMTIPVPGSGLYKIKQHDKWGVADSTGCVLVATEYDIVGNLKDSVLRVYKGTKLGLVDCTGQLVIPVGRYDFITPINSHLWLVEKEAKYGLMNTKWQELTTLTYEHIDVYDLSYGKVRRLDYMNLYHSNSNGNIVLLLTGLEHAALLDKTGRYLLSADYERIELVNANTYIVKKDGLYGVLNDSLETVIPMQYQCISPFYKGFAIKKSNKIGIFDDNYTPMAPFVYDTIVDGFVVRNGKYGYIDSQFQLKIPPVYDELVRTTNARIEPSVSDNILKFRQANKWGILKHNKVLIPAHYDEVALISDDWDGSYHFEIVNNHQKGWASSQGQTLVPCTYDDIAPSSDSLIFQVTKHNLLGLVKAGGEILLPPTVKCTYLDVFHAGWARAITLIPIQGLWEVCFVNKQGEIRRFESYDNVGVFSDKGLAFALKHNKMKLIDTLGNIVTPFTYGSKEDEEDRLRYKLNDPLDDFLCDVRFMSFYEANRYFNFHDDVAIIMKGSFYGLINGQGDLITPIRYDYIEPLSSSLYKLSLNDKYGVANNEGKLILPLQYSYIYELNEFFYRVEMGDKEGMINHEGKFVLPIRYDYIEALNAHLYAVRINDKEGVYNEKGELILPIKYDDIGYLDGDLYTISKGNYQGVLNQDGKLVVPVVYDEVNVLNGGYYAVKSNSLVGIRDKNGTMLIPLKYHEIIQADYDYSVMYGITYLPDKHRRIEKIKLSKL